MNKLGIERPSDNRLAAVCHLLGLVPLYGAIACGVIWAMSCKKKNPAAFQARQALTVQLLFLGALLVAIFGMLIARGLWPLNGPIAVLIAELSRWFTGLVLVCSWVLFIFGALRTYQDPSFRYPVIGETLWPRDEDNSGEK